MTEKINQNWELVKVMFGFALLGIFAVLGAVFTSNINPEYYCENDYSIIPYDECILNFDKVQIANDESIAYLNGDFINSSHYIRRQARYFLEKELSKDLVVIKYRKMFIEGGKYE